MYKYVMLAMLATTTGCGFGHRISKDCGGTAVDLCRGVFGDAAAEAQADQAELQAQIDATNSAIAQTNEAVDALRLRTIAYHQQMVDTDLLLQQQIDALQAQGTATASMVASLSLQQVALQTQLNNAVVQIAVLSGYSSIVELVDPCGDGPGFDEILLRLSTGQLVAYFETGSRRFLSVLSPGNYRTTDAQGCNFSVSAAGVVQ